GVVEAGWSASRDPDADRAASGDVLHLHDLADLLAGGVRDAHDLPGVGFVVWTGHGCSPGRGVSFVVVSLLYRGQRQRVRQRGRPASFAAPSRAEVASRTSLRAAFWSEAHEPHSDAPFVAVACAFASRCSSAADRFASSAIMYTDWS